MTQTIVFRLEAEADVEEAFRWYEARSPGLGTEFIRAVDASLAAIERNPELYAVQHRDVRRALLRRFPYALFYRVRPTSLEILACFHVRRAPRGWQARVTQ